MTGVLHPAWCSLSLCDVTDPDVPLAGGRHRSEPITIDIGPTFRVSAAADLRHIEVSLTRVVAAWDTSTFLVLQCGGVEAAIPTDRAAEVLALLLSVVAQQEGHGVPLQNRKRDGGAQS